MESQKRKSVNSLIIFAANASVQPIAVMIETFDADVASGAVLGTTGADRTFANVAELIFDNVLMLGAIECGQRFAGLIALLGDHVIVGRIN